MIEIEFDYKQVKTTIQVNFNDKFEVALQKYTSKYKIDLNNVYFLANGQIINNKSELIQNIMNDSEKQCKKMKILVYSINDTINIENTNIIKSKEIICPKCLEPCKYIFKDYKIKLYDCKYGHTTENILLDKFIDTQNIDLSKIKCDICNEKTKAETFNNEFYICYECNKNICPLCLSKHDKLHTIIKYDEKNYKCNKHNEIFIKYCEDCKENICISCIMEHKNHKIIDYSEVLTDIKKMRKNMNNLKMTIDKFKENIKIIIDKYNKIIENFNIFYYLFIYLFILN